MHNRDIGKGTGWWQFWDMGGQKVESRKQKPEGGGQSNQRLKLGKQKVEFRTTGIRDYGTAGKQRSDDRGRRGNASQAASAVTLCPQVATASANSWRMRASVFSK